MSTPTRTELREWTANLALGPLDVANPKDEYVDSPASRSPISNASIAASAGAIARSSSMPLLSGPSGAGKSTELYRLRRDLVAAGYDATIFDITQYVSESSPIDVTEFLIALALGAHDALVTTQSGPQGPSFLARLGTMLRRLNINLEIGGVTAALSHDAVEVGALGAKIGVDLGSELKSSAPFVDELRSKLSFHIPQLYEEVAAFLRELLPDLGSERDQGSVLIVDGLEKLRGTTANDLDVQKSVEALFVHHAGRLKFKSHHIVYTVPTYLQFTSPGALPYDARLFVPVPHVHPRGRRSDDTGAAENVAELREVVARRIPVDGIFGDAALLDTIIQASGGHLRDMFRILQRLINLMLRLSLELPVGPTHVDEAIQLVGRDFAGMTEEQAAFLREVAGGSGVVRPAASQVQLMARLVQSHMLLGHVNGADWYEVHPLARRALGL